MYQKKIYPGTQKHEMFFPLQGFGRYGALFMYYDINNDKITSTVKFRFGLSEHVKSWIRSIPYSAQRGTGTIWGKAASAIAEEDYEPTMYINVRFNYKVDPDLLRFIFETMVPEPFDFMYWLSNAGREDLDAAEFQRIIQRNS